MAVYCSDRPAARDAFAGVIAIDTSVAVTVNGVEALVEPKVAWMVVLPLATPVARPKLVIVAAAVLLELQVTVLVRFCCEPSLYIPVAVYCWVLPFTIEVLVGVIAIETRVGGVTVSSVEPFTEPEFA